MTTTVHNEQPPKGHAERSQSLAERFYPEVAVGGFSRDDWSVAFWSQVAALLQPEHHVLDFGAGRGEHIIDDPVAWRRQLATLKGRCAHVTGCDVSPAVLTNPFIDKADQIAPGASLPYPDASFDLIVSRMVFEHLPDAAATAAELTRVLKPGGWLAVVTPNKWGYVALASRMVPNRLHAQVLQSVQPGRKGEDVFPTHYRLNTLGDLRRQFEPGCTVHAYRTSSEPAYHFGSPFIYGLTKVLHTLLPSPLHTAILAFIQKKPG